MPVAMHRETSPTLNKIAPALLERHPELKDELVSIARSQSGMEAVKKLEELQQALNSGQCQPGVREEYLTSLVHQLANPSLLNQGGDITCTQLAGMWTVFRTDPAYAASLCVSLATKGEATLKGEQKIKIELQAEDLKEDMPKDVGRFDKRTQSEKALQKALFRAFSEPVSIIGSNGQPVVRQATSVMTFLNQREQLLGDPQIGVTRKMDIYSLIKESVKEHNGGSSLKGTQVALNFMPEGAHQLHCVTIEGIDVDQKGQAWVSVYHGWGKYFADMGGIERKRDPETGLESIKLEDFIRNSEILVLNSDNALVNRLGIQSSIEEYAAAHPEAMLVVDPNDPLLFPKKKESGSMASPIILRDQGRQSASKFSKVKNIDPSLGYSESRKQGGDKIESSDSGEVE